MKNRAFFHTVCGAKLVIEAAEIQPNTDIEVMCACRQGKLLELLLRERLDIEEEDVQ